MSKYANPPWATIESGLRAFVDLLNTTWYADDGDSEVGDELGQLLLDKLEVPAEHPVAERILKLREDFRIYVADQDESACTATHFSREAQNILMSL